ncbi:MAG TPA: Tn3 family transposase [Terriglobales bacterium]|nr:Tn3 family transposase [Terriglobales bacterium]
MPVPLLSTTERDRANRFPPALTAEDLVTFFTLSEADQEQMPVHAGPHIRLGFALELCALRFMGFVPDDLTSAPPEAVTFIAQQLALAPEVLAHYTGSAHTRMHHRQTIQAYLGYRKMQREDRERLAAWLVERALEHDKPLLLYTLLCEQLRTEHVLRPGVTRLERLVTAARMRAETETFQPLTPLLTDDRRQWLDTLLAPDPARGMTPLAWLRRPAIASSPRAIVGNLEKLAFLRSAGVEEWPLEALHPNRRKFLAQLTRTSSAQALQRAPTVRRYPQLLAFCVQCLTDVTDEVIEMFDRCLAEAYARAGKDLEDFRTAMAHATNEKVHLFRELARAVLDPAIADPSLRSTIYQRIPATTLRHAAEESDRIVRPLDDSYFDFFETRYGYLRQCTPAFLDTFTFHTHQEPAPLLEAVQLLQQLNRTHRRTVPSEAPTDFIPLKWRPYVVDPAQRIDRHYYELCTLWELRGALRAGDVWVASSRRYANPETYLIPKDRWAMLRPEVCQQLQAPEDGAIRLAQRGGELTEVLPRVERLLARRGQTGTLRMDKGRIVVPPLDAEERPERIRRLEDDVASRLPLIDLPELLIEVDQWTGFSHHLRHLNSREPRRPDFLPVLYAALLAQGCNFGFARMAQMADLSADRLAWCTTWYLREETLKAATTALVNYHHRLPLSQRWGGGTLSSSDGQRIPVAGKIRKATALPRYFRYQGLTFYSWTSDQLSQYGTKVIPATVRDATYVLDALLDNETELTILEHATDTAGYTDIVFALFDLLGMQFAPRLRDIGDQQLYRFSREQKVRHLAPRMKGTIRHELIVRHWDDLLRLAGSLKRGWVTASLFISKLQAYPRQNILTRALQEYGRLIKTLFILRYLENPAYRRRINAQLNKGESLHALRDFLFAADKGVIRRKQEEAQTNQAMCLNLVTNAVVVWNTVYMQAALDQLRTEGYPVQEDDLAHLSPARFEHVNPYGKYYFPIDEATKRQGLRPLRAA